jgi:membrane fusion protein (multidrug efflux system)
MSRLAFWGRFTVLIFAVAAAVFLFQRFARDSSKPDSAPPAAEPLVAVDVKPVMVDTVQRIVRAVGSLRPDEAVIIAPEIAGRIARLSFAEGEAVSAGEVLVTLDAEMLEAELSRAQSELALARANRDRLATLAEQGTGSLRARDEAVAAFHVAEAAVVLAQLRLEKSELRAPFSGIVGVRAASVGAFVIPGQRIVELVATDPIKVDFRVPELALPSLQIGQSVRVTIDALPGESFPGEVHVIDPVVDASGRAAHLQARIPNPEGRLSPGLFARVEIVVDENEDAVLVPESAVFSKGQARYAFRVVAGRAVQTPLELGQRRAGAVEVVRGLDAGAVVVTAGQQKLRDGSRVRPADAGARDSAER